MLYLVIPLKNLHNALDTVNQGILLDKLSHYGIRGPAYDWFSSYLNERYQSVVYNGCESEHKYIQCGVPQGSILGPLLFLIYINDLPSGSNLFMPILYANDTNLFCTGRNIHFLVNEINDEMSKAYSWVKANKLSLNIDKTTIMSFTPKCFSRTMGNILIDGHPISEVKETKFLGVIVDNNLKWSAHIQYISRKISKGIAGTDQGNPTV